MPATPEMNRLLAEIIGLRPQVDNSKIARSILLGTSADFGAKGANGPGGGGASDAGPSIVSRIFDVLSRPNYAVAETYQTWAEEMSKAQQGKAPDVGNIVAGIGRGLAGKDKTTFSGILAQNAKNRGEKPGAGQAIPGFLLDVFTDPTTFVGGGAVKGVGRALGIGKKAVEATKPELLGKLSIVDQGPKARVRQPLPTPVEPGMVHPRANKVPVASPPVGVLPFSVPGSKVKPSSITWTASPEAQIAAQVTGKGEEGYKKAFAAFMQQAKVDKGPVPKKADFKNMQAYAAARSEWAKGNLAPKAVPVTTADQLIEGISKGDIPSTIRVAPNPPSAPRPTPMQSSAAISVARKFLGRVSNAEKHLNPEQQMRIFKNLLSRTVGSPVERLTQTQTMLREAEKFFHSQGWNMKYWDGMHMKLSDLIDEMGGPSRVSLNGFLKLMSKAPDDPVLVNSIEALRARSAMHDTPFVKLALDQTTAQMPAAEKVMSPAKFADFQDHLRQEARAGLRAADVSPGSISQVEGIIKQIADAHNSPTQAALNSKKLTLIKVVSGAEPAKWQEVNAVITKSIEGITGISAKQAGTKIGLAAKTMDSLATRFATNYGMKNLRPTELDYVLSAEANAERRHRVWRELIRNSSPEERLNGFRVAQGVLPPMGGRDMSIGQQFGTSMERLFSSSGVRDSSNSVALRSGMLMEDLNKELKRVGSEHYFNNEKQYANGADWLKSWESWEMKGDPINAIARIETAVERVTKRYALFDEVAARWGSKVADQAYRFKVGNPRLDGVYFTKDMASEIQRMTHSLDNMYDPKSTMVKYFDEVLSIWKTAVTIYSPAHHIRNGIGDAWLSWVAGVNNPGVYRQAAKVMHAQRGRYGQMPGVELLVGSKAKQYANANVRGDKTLLNTRGGIPLTPDQIYIAAHQRGLLLSARQIEDIFGEPMIRGKIQPFGGRVHDTVAAISQNREHYFRLAHFIDAVKKSKEKNIEDVFNEAAHTVRKWHPDGMDLTNFERKYLRRIFPFYSWSRKAIPLVMEAILMKPGKVIMYPKGMEALQVAMGIDAPSRTDPFPTNQLFPDWVREKGIGPIGLSTALGGTGIGGFIGDTARQGVDSRSGYDIGGYAIVNPSNPMIDSIAQFASGNPINSAIQNMNPLAKIPIELGMNQNANTGAPIYGSDYSDPARYATEQVPLLAQLSRLTNVGVGGVTGKGQREGVGNMEAVINQLTAAGLLGTGPFIKQGQFEQKRRQR